MKSFLILVSSVLAATFVIVFTIRFIGSTSQFAPLENQFQLAENIEIIAHRGGALEAPENTLFAFRKAAKIDPSIILELDVHLTKDKVAIVIHDETVDRTTNASGRVGDLTLNEIKALDAGFQFENEKGEFPYRGQDISVPTLKEFLDEFKERRIVLEIKEDSQEASDAVIQEIENSQIDTNNLLIGSMHGRVIDYVRSKKPTWHFSASKTESYRSLILLSMFLETVDPMKPAAFLIPEKHNGIKILSKRLLTEVNRRKKPIYVWTINELEEMKRLISFGVQGLITDRPTLLYAELKK